MKADGIILTGLSFLKIKAFIYIGDYKKCDARRYANSDSGYFALKIKSGFNVFNALRVDYFDGHK